MSFMSRYAPDRRDPESRAVAAADACSPSSLLLLYAGHGCITCQTRLGSAGCRNTDLPGASQLAEIARRISRLDGALPAEAPMRHALLLLALVGLALPASAQINPGPDGPYVAVDDNGKRSDLCFDRRKSDTKVSLTM